MAGLAEPLREEFEGFRSRLAPRHFHEMIGNPHILGPGSMLSAMLRGRALRSLALTGAPGTGRTAAAEVLIRASGRRSLVAHGLIASPRILCERLTEARSPSECGGRPGLVFVQRIDRLPASCYEPLVGHLDLGGTLIAEARGAIDHLPEELRARLPAYAFEPVARTQIEAWVERLLDDPRAGLNGVRIRDPLGLIPQIVEECALRPKLAIEALERGLTRSERPDPRTLVFGERSHASALALLTALRARPSVPAPGGEDTTPCDVAFP